MNSIRSALSCSVLADGVACSCLAVRSNPMQPQVVLLSFLIVLVLAAVNATGENI